VSASEGISLLGHLKAPILVGDPEGRVVYANATFLEKFCVDRDDPIGEPLAMVFGGGAREVVLQAIAQVLQRGQAARFQIREGGAGYSGLASPIEARDDRVGVVMVLLEEHGNDEHLAALAEEIGEPIGEAMRALKTVSERAGHVLREPEREALERGLRAAETAKKWLRELQVALRSGKTQQGRFDVTHSIIRVRDRFQQESDEADRLELLMAPNLPRVMGSSVVFERLLGQLLRQRVDEARPGTPLTLLVRALGGTEPRAVIVSLVDLPDPDHRRATGLPPESVQQGMASMGGESACVEDSHLGRVTAMRFPVAGH